MFRIGRSPEKTAQGLEKTRERWFSRVRRLFQRPKLSEAVWEELEELLISADVGVATTQDLLRQVQEREAQGPFTNPAEALQALREEMVTLLEAPRRPPPLPLQPSVPDPLVVTLMGVNGSGKTTAAAKLGYQLQQQGFTVLLAAADTFRSAAIEQLEVWGHRLGVPVIAHQPGGDPGAVVFDALQAARARGIQVVLVDTAGRLHTKYNLMEELKKLHRVAGRVVAGAPHQVLLVLDATTGQNGLAQARTFQEAVGCSGVFLTKLDGTAKGGIVLAIARELELPVLYLGTGEKVWDIVPFDAREFVEALLAEG